jgi:hypothetical protein
MPGAIDTGYGDGAATVMSDRFTGNGSGQRVALPYGWDRVLKSAGQHVS